MSEMRSGGGAVDPSKLHLKKELTQIRKAARVLRDPGTTSSWKSPLMSAATPPFGSAAVAVTSDVVPKYCDSAVGRLPGSHCAHGRSKKVFLHNWRSSCRSSSEKSSAAAAQPKSRRCRENGPAAAAGGDEDDDGSSSVPGSLAETSTCGGDSQSPLSGRLRRDANMVSSSGTPPPIPARRAGVGMSKKRSKKLQRLQHKQQQQMVLGKRKSAQSRRPPLGNAALAAPPMCLGLSQDDSESLLAPSDDTEDYYNSEDLRQISAASPLLARLRQTKKKKKKNAKWSHSSSKMLVRSSRREDSSYTYNSTPALSTSSYNNIRYAFNRNPSTVGSWDGTSASFAGGDDWADDDHLDLPGRKGCGIPCCWSRRTTPKHRAYGGSCCSPSLSDTLRRKGSSILCGSQKMYGNGCARSSSVASTKRKTALRTAQGVLPLLTNGSSMGSGAQSDDELSTNFGELDLEALSRLDGRRWSTSCRSEEALELQALTTGESKEGSTPENIRSLSQKYRPLFFDELIGQNIVVQSLTNAVSRGRIAPVYLFQGPRGTGKTSAARIFAAALNCMATEESKPCGVCRECTDFLTGKTRDLRKIDGTNKKAVEKIKYLLKNLLVIPQSAAFSRYKVFVIDECHLLPSKVWLAFLKFLEEPLPRIVFIFITTDLDSMPRTILSRCQKYLFNKIRDCDIVGRLRKISDEENLDVELDALDLIALNADGSLRDAETMLDQLSLLGKRITGSLVNELLGVVSDDKLLELLELAMSPDTAETVKRARELLDSGVDPTVLMSQLASLIMDLIAGTYRIADTESSDSFFGGRSLTEGELEKLKHALKLLSDAEKQLRVSSERSTWFTAALLQLGAVSSSDFTQSGSSRRQSSKTTDEDPSSASKEVPPQKHNPDAMLRTSSSSLSIPYSYTHHGDLLSLQNFENFNSKSAAKRLIDGGASAASRDGAMVGNVVLSCINSDKLDNIWTRCIERCHSKTLRQLLHAHGKLLSICEVEGNLIVYIAFKDGDIKSRADRFLSSITDSIETILRCNVEVKIILLPDTAAPSKPIELPESSDIKQRDTMSANREGKHNYGNSSYSNKELQEAINLKAGRRDCSNCSPSFVSGTFKSAAGSPFLNGGNTEINGMKESRSEMPMQRIESIIREQNLESAWLQTAEKGTPRLMSRLKPEKNQVLPQDGTYRQSRMESTGSQDLPLGHWEDESNHGIKIAKINDVKGIQNDHHNNKTDRYPMSPSLLHDSSFTRNFSKDTLGYESGSGNGGCGKLFCWNITRNHKRVKVKKVTSLRPDNGGRFSWFGECGMSKGG